MFELLRRVLFFRQLFALRQKENIFTEFLFLSNEIIYYELLGKGLNGHIYRHYLIVFNTFFADSCYLNELFNMTYLFIICMIKQHTS